MRRTTPPPAALLLLLAACGGSDETTPNVGIDVPPDLVYNRARSDSPHHQNDSLARSAQNLGTGRIGNRAGREMHVRVHPDGNRILFVRELDFEDPESRELFLGTIDNSVPEQRLTANDVRDDNPCFSPDGTWILFTSNSSGEDRIYRMSISGLGTQLFTDGGPGTNDSEPDWSVDDRVVWSRRGTDGVTQLWLAWGDGSMPFPLTTGVPAIAGQETGDRQAAFTPNGNQALFVRRLGNRSLLQLVSIGTGAMTTVYAPDGIASRPRMGANNRIFCGLDEPDLGRPGPRLCEIAFDGAYARLVVPDKRWWLDGVDLLPTLGPAIAGSRELLDVGNAGLEVPFGTVTGGNRASMRTGDGNSLQVATFSFEGKEVAGINTRFTLPVPSTDDVIAIEVSATVSVTRADAGSVLRLAMHNPVDGRFDTITELPPDGTGATTLKYATQSLAHVTGERQVRIEVVAELPAGTGAELHIDELAVTLVSR